MGRYLDLADQALADIRAGARPGPSVTRYDQNDINDERDNPATSKEGETAPEPAHEWTDGVAQLMRMSTPDAVPPKAWAQLASDSKRFLSEWAEQAFRLGWTVHDLWGCHETRPYDRLDYAGLLWLLDGHEIGAMTADAATIKFLNGRFQTYRRRLIPTDGVLAWDLNARIDRFDAVAECGPALAPYAAPAPDDAEK
jgi:hypothetical protein